MIRSVSILTVTALHVGIGAAIAQETQLLWGDTHLHSNLSPDAYVQRNTTATPDDSFMFAKGAPVLDALTGAKVQIDTPLDFLVLTDHAEYVGIPRMIWGKDERLMATEIGQRFAQMIADGEGTKVFFELVETVNSNEPIADLNTEELRTTIWAESFTAAEKHNQPGQFTAFIGWEWSSIPQGQNLHRIVFMPEGADVAEQFIPFSAFDSDVESEFWAWLDETSARTGANFVAIPHNGNISNGLMFPETDRAGNPIDTAYAETRMRWEPVIETTQIKGDSETHPALSPDDAFADFETFEHLIKTDDSDTGDIGEARPGSYTRAGLMRGLEVEEKIGANPFKYGMIGATDSHSGYSTAEEDNFWGKFSLDAIAANKADKELIPGAFGWDMAASGLAGVWAAENTRESITEAFQRREVYATSGPRIALRVFAGFDFEGADAEAVDIASVGYAKGVPMGSDLTEAPADKAPSFLVHAVKDPKHANLDRVQMVKGWVGADGVAMEKVYDIAWSDDREVGADGQLPPVGNSVDLETGLYTNDIGAAQLSTVWTDPEFNAGERAFYYVRVLQIPTPRNSTYDAIALKIDPAETGKPATIQERAYASPIWYAP
ncbi:MAG: DUF3604 domain-containing protein [Alphaproteobacteria bacterium]|nr:DUF3604 domain-containing protein [Alphaproteobacteria bacterium]